MATIQKKANSISQAKFDIIITTYNALIYLKRCLRSIRKHTDNLDYRITVIDNGSGDGVKSYLKCLKEINFISLKKNYGPSRAVNTGVKATDREFVVRLDDDTEVTPGWLVGLYLSLVTDEKIGIVSTKTVLGDGRIFLADGLAKFCFAYGYGEYDRGQRDYVRYCDLLPGPVMFFKRDLINKIGFFDERLKCTEDMDFFLRARLGGYKLLYNGKYTVIHHHLRRYRNVLAKYNKIFCRKWSDVKMFPLKDSHPVDKHNTLGFEKLSQGKYKKALYHFGKSYSLDKRFGLPFFMGLALLNMNRIEEAIGKFKEALYINPSDFRIYYHLGMIYKKIGIKRQATSFLQKALMKTPLLALEINSQYE